MGKQLKTLLICILIPLAVGAVAGILTSGSMEAFMQLNKPPLSPPGWLFPVVWTILYILMGIASYLVLTSKAPEKEIKAALELYIFQLGVNFLWSFIFFTFELYWAAFVCLILLWVLIIMTIKRFYAVSPNTVFLLLPYLAWVSFAGYLNLSICLLN